MTRDEEHDFYADPKNQTPQGPGRRRRGNFTGTRVLLLVADRDVRVLNQAGETLAEFHIDPAKQYQIKNRPGLPQ